MRIAFAFYGPKGRLDGEDVLAMRDWPETPKLGDFIHIVAPYDPGSEATDWRVDTVRWIDNPSSKNPPPLFVLLVEVNE